MARDSLEPELLEALRERVRHRRRELDEFESGHPERIGGRIGNGRRIAGQWVRIAGHSSLRRHAVGEYARPARRPPADATAEVRPSRARFRWSRF